MRADARLLSWNCCTALCMQKRRAFVVENYLPIAFAVALTFALAYPVPGTFLVRITVAGNVHIIQVRTSTYPEIMWSEGNNTHSCKHVSELEGGRVRPPALAAAERSLWTCCLDIHLHQLSAPQGTG